MLFNCCVGLVGELLWVCLDVVLACVYCCLDCGVSLLVVVVCLFYFCLGLVAFCFVFWFGCWVLLWWVVCCNWYTWCVGLLFVFTLILVFGFEMLCFGLLGLLCGCWCLPFFDLFDYWLIVTLFVSLCGVDYLCKCWCFQLECLNLTCCDC